MTKASESNDFQDQGERPPHRVRLPGFISDEEVGLGDVMKRATSYLGGGRPCCFGRERVRGFWYIPISRPIVDLCPYGRVSGLPLILTL
jgi:hypothetical protein